MKIVKLKAGLGNQMFQYAFMRLLQVKYGFKEVLLDTSYFGYKDYMKYVESGLDMLKVSYHVASRDDLKKIHVPYNNFQPHHLMHRIVSASQAVINPKYYFEKNRAYVNIDSILKYSYFDGYWQSWKYLEPIRKILIEEFQPRNGLSELSKSYVERYGRLNSVFVGVRKGDYTESSKATSHYGAPSLKYYKRALKIINQSIQDPFFVVFSDDIEWVKANIDFKKIGIREDQIEYRDQGKIFSDFEEIYVMASCKHAIISNSTFNFWGAWMIKNPMKIVIAPKDWFKDGKPIDIIPPLWKRI